MTKMNVPKLRFKGFSGEWKEDKLSSRVSFISGNEGYDGDIPILTISASNGWMNQKDRFGKVLAGNELKNYTLLKKGQLSYNHGNSKVAKYGAVFSLKEHSSALVPRVYHSFEINDGSPLFIENMFLSKKPDKQLRKLITSGARMDGLLNINKTDFGSIKLWFTNRDEQRKIGEFFKKIDKLIELQTKKLEALKNLKRGYLQKMFPRDGEKVPRLRFNNFIDEWKNVQIDKICKSSSSKYTQGQFKDNPNQGSNIVFDVSGVAGKSSRFDQSYEYVSIVKDGSGVGKVSMRPAKTSVINTMNYITSKNSDIKYIYYLLENFNFEKYKIGTGIPHIYFSDYSKHTVNIPSLDEQKKISSFLNVIDSEINNIELKISLLKKQKKSYLQKMFI